MTAAADRVDLGVRPTPVFEAAALRPGLWIKDDGASAPHYGGNKPRKLEYLLHDAPRGIATMGARGSHHALATAVHGTLCGLEVHVVAFPRPANEHVEAIYAATKRRAVMHMADDMFAARDTLEGLRHDGMRVIPSGGSSPVGALGFVRAGRELVEQIKAGVCPEPRHVYVAMGTASTVVGLSLALGSAGLDTQVCAIRVVPEDWLSRSDVEQLARDTAALSGLPFAMPSIDDTWLGGGYGEPTTEAMAAVANASGIVKLESTYTGKALAAACVDSQARVDAECAPVLFWQTHNSHSIEALLNQGDGSAHAS